MIEDKIIVAITSHAQRVFPLECCGLVIDNGGVLHYVECDNQSHAPETSFLIDPLVYLQYAERVKLVVHSHPNGSAKLSEADKASAERAAIPFLVMAYPTCETQCYTPSGYVSEFEGRQFVYGIFDCLGLVADFYKSQMLIDLPEVERPAYGWWHDKENLNTALNHFLNRGFKKVDSPIQGDVVLMQLQGVVPNHVAVFLAGGLIMHQILNNISRQEQYGNFWRKNTICYLRYGDD